MTHANGIRTIETTRNKPKQINMKVTYEPSMTKLFIFNNMGEPFLIISAGIMNGICSALIGGVAAKKPP